MQLTNAEIYDYAVMLNKSFTGSEQFPIKFNFYLQKNMKLIMSLAQEINISRTEVGTRYGTLNEETGLYDLNKDTINEAKHEYEELMALTQDVNIYTFCITDLPDDMILSMK